MDFLDQPGPLMAFTKNCAMPLISIVCWCVAQTPSWAAFFYEGLYKMHFYFLTLNFYHFKTLVEKNKWMIGERKARTWVRLDTVLSTFPRYWLKTSHEMLRLICLLISVHKRCDIVCTIHLVLNLRFSLLLVLSHVTIVSCGKKEFAVFFKQRHFIGQKKSFF